MHIRSSHVTPRKLAGLTVVSSTASLTGLSQDDDEPNGVTGDAEYDSAGDPLPAGVASVTHTHSPTQPVADGRTHVSRHVKQSQPAQSCCVGACDRLGSCGLVLTFTTSGGDRNIFICVTDEAPQLQQVISSGPAVLNPWVTTPSEGQTTRSQGSPKTILPIRYLHYYS